MTRMRTSTRTGRLGAALFMARAGRTAPRLLAAAALAVLAAGCGSDGGDGDGGGGGLRDAATADTGTSDAAADATVDSSDDTATDVGPGPCPEDPLGATNANAPYTLDASGFIEGVVVCPGEDDWLEARLAADGRLVVEFLTDRVDELEVVAVADDGTLLANGATFDDRVRVAVAADTARRVRVRASASGIANIETDLGIRIEGASDCAADDYEPNETFDSPAPLAPTLGADGALTLEGELCPGDADWFVTRVEPGETVSWVLDFVHEDGDLELRGFLDGNDREPVVVSETASDREAFVLGPYDEATTVLVEVYGYRGATGPWTLTATRLPTDGTEATASGTVAYQDRPYDTGGFVDELVELPMQNGVVEVIRDIDGVVVGTSTTDAEGAFTIDYTALDGLEYRVRALAAAQVSDLDVRVRDRSDAAALYALTSEPFTSEGGADVALLAARGDAIGGAMNIADVAAEAFRFIDPWVEGPAELTYSWQPGLSFSCGSCYSNDIVSLGGQLEDPDEYDDDIILHELGHWFVDHFSDDDSPGGSHRDRQVEPRLAFGEGLAYFFAGMVRDTPHIVDNFLDERRWIDMEAVLQNGEDRFDLVGTTTGSLGGSHREEIVAAVMWDAYDGATEDEPWDVLEIGAEGHMDLLTGIWADDDVVDVGASGDDLADWVLAATCFFDWAPEDVQPVVDDREYPWDASGDEASCAEKGGTASWIELILVKGDLWLTTREAPPGAPIALDVIVDDGETTTKSERTCDALPCRIVTSTDENTAVVLTGTIDGQWQGASWIGLDAAQRMLGGDRLVSVGGQDVVREYRTR